MARPKIRTKEYWIKYNKDYYKRNKDRHYKLNKEWVKNNLERYKKYQKKFRDLHKDSASKYHKLYSEENREYLLELKKKWLKIGDNKEKDRISKQKSYHKFKMKYRTKNYARQKGERANKTKLPCVICGEIKLVHRHHPDYSKPEQIIWLCRKHHNLLHRIVKEEFIKNYDTSYKIRKIIKIYGKLS